MSRPLILVVDDEEPFRDIVEHALITAGYLVTTAGDGNEARERIKAARPDLVITDMLMPDCDGVELIKQIRAIDPGLPVVSMSGGGKLPSGLYLNIAHSIGANALLEKPFTTPQLLSTVSQILGATPHHV